MTNSKQEVMELLTQPERWRRWSVDEKLTMVREEVKIDEPLEKSIVNYSSRGGVDGLRKGFGFMCKKSVIAITCWMLLMGFAPSSSAQTTPYGDCPASAQQYQNRYQSSGNVSDLVCLQYALQRELEGRQTISSSKPAAELESNKVLSRDETYCMDQQKDPGSLTRCLAEQGQASKEVADFLNGESQPEDARDKVSECTGYTTGWRSLGSMENIDQVPVARCIRTAHPRVLFDTCINAVTSKPAQGMTRFWNRQESEKIASCFNAKTK